MKLDYSIRVKHQLSRGTKKTTVGLNLLALVYMHTIFYDQLSLLKGVHTSVSVHNSYMLLHPGLYNTVSGL